MAPTVCVSEGSERFSLEDHLTRLASIHCRSGERRRHFQIIRKRPHHKQTELNCHKVQMGLIVEECLQQPVSPALDCEDERPSEDTASRQDHLILITLRTLALLRRNQQLQYKLSLLQAETRAFVESVLSPSSPAADR